jgi:hypothetical protein
LRCHSAAACHSRSSGRRASAQEILGFRVVELGLCRLGESLGFGARRARLFLGRSDPLPRWSRVDLRAS